MISTEPAKREGVTGLKGCAIVDIKNAKFEQGAVVGKRIGKAYDWLSRNLVGINLLA